MSVQVNCPHCLTPCEIPDHQADKVLSCGNCQKTFRMKTPAEPAPQTPAPAATTAKPPAKPAAADPHACFASEAFIALDGLPPSLLMASIDAAPYLLTFTRHSVIAGPEGLGDQTAKEISS